MAIILASTSASRKKLLQRLGLPFTAVAPDCDETPLANENPVALVLRLSRQKAESIVNLADNNSIIIGADQVGELHGQILGKPLTCEKAYTQLRRCSGQVVRFYTGLTVLNTASKGSVTLYDPFEVHFRILTDEEIKSYITKEKPLHCAGSFKCDGLGITLFNKLKGEDICSLTGLPLLRLNQILINIGYNPLLH